MVLKWLDTHAGAVQAVATIVLVLLTFTYVLLTRSLAKHTKSSVEQVRDTAQTATTLRVMVDVFREWRANEKIMKGRILVRRYMEQQEDKPPVDQGYGALPHEVVAVSHYLDNLGALVGYRVVDEATVRLFIGGAVIAMWRFFEPYCVVERGLRAARHDATEKEEVPYQCDFEYLALTFQRNP